MLTDSILGILSHDPDKCSGNQFIDEDFLRDWMGCKNFSKYQCLPGKMERVEVLLLGDGEMLTFFLWLYFVAFFLSPGHEPPTMEELVSKLGGFDAGRAKV